MEQRRDNRAVVSWRKLKCRWLGILLSSHSSPHILETLSLISLSSHFSLTLLLHFLSPCSSLLSSPSVPAYSPSCTHLHQPHSFLPALVCLSDPNCMWQWILSLAMSCLLPGAAANPGRRKADLFCWIVLHFLPLVMTLWSEVMSYCTLEKGRKA